MFQIEHFYKCIFYILLSLHTLLCSIEVNCLVNLKLKMKLYNLPCLMEEDICRFQTIQLEFPKAKEILEMHMILVHGRPESRDKCDSCDRDTKNDTEINQDDNEAICDEVHEALHNVPEHSIESNATTAVSNTNEANQVSLM